MKLTAAVAQTASVLLDTPATVERALALMAQAAAQGARRVRQTSHSRSWGGNCR